MMELAKGAVRMDGPSSATLRGLLVRALAVTALIPAVIHFAVAGEHFSEYWAFGVFMLVVAWLQLAWAIGLLVRPSRLVIAAGGLLNAGVVAVYIVTRTAGDVVGPDPHDVEPVGFGDAFCTACEVLLVVGVAVLLVRSLRRPVPQGWATAAVAGTAALGAVLLSVSLVDGGSEMVMSMGSDDAPGSASTAAAASMNGMAGMTSAALSLPTDSPAGPVTTSMGDMDMAGMQMVTSPCTAAPTAAEQAATVKLVNETWAADKKYRSLALAKADGFAPITPSGAAVVHYLSPANYARAAAGAPVIDPDAPQSLVYANTPEGAVLVAVMYLDPANNTSTPQPGGCLTQWHVHTNLCFGPAGTVVGITHPDCAPGTTHRPTPPMMHVWFAPIPGGPTAVDAPDRQVVRAAELVGGPHNGTA
ncbi:MAG TPA: hypothetical protein VF288_09400 [Mycobacteriales bacterium]